MGAIRQPSPGRSGEKTYQVWHNKALVDLQRQAQYHGYAPVPHFPEGFVHFADVQANGLAEAVQKTSDMPSPFVGGYPQWSEENGVRKQPGCVYRDTEPGDVIVDPGGRAFRYEYSGFKELDADGYPGWRTAEEYNELERREYSMTDPLTERWHEPEPGREQEPEMEVDL